MKTAAKPRGKFADEKYLGPEPQVTVMSSNMDLAQAYNWFNYFYTSDDAKSFTISYLKSIKYDRDIIHRLAQVKAIDLHNIGWNCRLLSTGSTLPDELWEKIEDRIKFLASQVVEQTETTEDQPQKNVISIQDRINNKAIELTGELEEQLDVFFNEGVIQFDIKKWALEKGIKPQIAKRITDKFRPQYEEILEAIEGNDPDLVEAYGRWRKPVLKVMALFIKRIIDHMETSATAAIAQRRPRKKKIKPPSVLVAKMQFMPEYLELNIKSIDPKSIINSSQLWTYNVKTRNLSVYHAMDSNGLSVRGTTITGHAEGTSITKKLRKPEEILPQVLSAGKVDLRGIMKNLSTKESEANGRINKDTVLIRTLK